MIEIILPYPNMALSPNRRNGKHFGSTVNAKISDRKMGEYAAIEVKCGFVATDKDYALTIAFYHPTKACPDLDNLLSASKHRLDGIALTLGINDKRFHPITLRREYRKGDGGMKIIIE